MNTEEKVLRYAPDFYNENRDMLAVYNSQNKELALIGDKSLQAFLNNFVWECDYEGIRRWEKIFNIYADEINESLEYRKSRIANKLVQQPPFTKIFLEQMLTNLFGEDKFTLQILYDIYIIKLDIETDIEGLFEETVKELRQIIPANMAIEVIQVEPYRHIYLNKYYTYVELEQFTYGELSQYAEVE